MIVDEAYLEYTPTSHLVPRSRSYVKVQIFWYFEPLTKSTDSRAFLSAIRLRPLNCRRIYAIKASARPRPWVASTSRPHPPHWMTQHMCGASAPPLRQKGQSGMSFLMNLACSTRTHRQTSSFFDAGLPQSELANAFRTSGVEIVRSFSPYTNWARITIGLPEENRVAQRLLREVLRRFAKNSL